MNEAEKVAAKAIILAASTRRYEQVFFLGPFAKRVSFASQQNRVLNLIWALRGMDRLQRDHTVAIVGAGLSGITASVALAKLGCNVSLFETAELALNRQSGAHHRLIHPTINSWPGGDLSPTTMLPFFDWISDRCDSVMEALATEWAKQQHIHKARIRPVWETTITELREYKNKVLLDCVEGGNRKLASQKFDLAIVTSGFRDEPIGARHYLKTYWFDDGLESLVNAGKRRFLVCGSGDGGLIDTLRIAHKHFNHGKLCVEIAELLRSSSWKPARRILDAENEIAASPDIRSVAKIGSVELQKVYVSAAAALPKDVKERLKVSLRSRRGLVTLVSRQNVPYSPLSAPIHKLLLAHAIQRETVTYQAGTLLDDYGFDHMRVETLSGILELKGTVIIRQGAGPNFDQFLSESDAKALENRQIELAADLDSPLWAEGKSALITWPPEPRDDGRFDRGQLSDRAEQAQKIVNKLKAAGDLEAALSPDELLGFCLRYSRKTKKRTLKLLPKLLFGFPLVLQPLGTEVARSIPHGAPAFAPKTKSPEVLEPGTVIVATMDGRLGPFVRDAKGKLFSLTVGHLIAETMPRSREDVYDAGGAVVGTPRHYSDPHAKFIDEKRALALIEISEGRRWTNSYGPFGSIKYVAAPNTVFGKSVRMVSRRGITMHGYVSSSGCSVSVPDPVTLEPKIYDGAVRVRSDNSAPFSEGGDSGAPVLDEDGNLVGLILSGNEEFSFVAPALAFFHRFNLELAVEAHTKSHRAIKMVDQGASTAGHAPSHAWNMAVARRMTFQDAPLDLGDAPSNLKND